ncbi:MAG: NAD(P)-dependent oxidoreductase [Alphaproteobacteria bacterium]|nr:NAD(P)-dependent oxidoreductase [Alphaproteobacteria bacterium]
MKDTDSEAPDIKPGRLDRGTYAHVFDDINPPLSAREALIEAARCHFCFDAPCVEACPTSIDIPSFIGKIRTGNLKGSAIDILSANIFGGTCARVCPVEELCEEACVRTTGENKPVKIGLLQRHAVDALMKDGAHPFTRAPDSGKKIAVVGTGPAGLACAHRLAMLGHNVDVYEARAKPGGLNEHGIAAYKVPDDFAQKEVAWLLGIGGIKIYDNKALGRDVTLDDLRKRYNAVFLGTGLQTTQKLGLGDETLEGVEDAVGYIERLRQAKDLSKLPVGRRVVVIGGGNTAIDIAIQSKRLGAEDVTLVYRRGPSQMGATDHEQHLAQTEGVRIKHWVAPVKLIGWRGKVKEIELAYTRLDDAGKLVLTEARTTLLADMVFKAIGQQLVKDPFDDNAREPLAIKNGKLVVNDERETSLPGVYAGGDCTATGSDLTVRAVEDGKLAAIAIDKRLRR